MTFQDTSQPIPPEKRFSWWEKLVGMKVVEPESWVDGEADSPPPPDETFEGEPLEVDEYTTDLRPQTQAVVEPVPVLVKGAALFSSHQEHVTTVPQRIVQANPFRRYVEIRHRVGTLGTGTKVAYGSDQSVTCSPDGWGSAWTEPIGNATEFDREILILPVQCDVWAVVEPSGDPQRLEIFEILDQGGSNT